MRIFFLPLQKTPLASDRQASWQILPRLLIPALLLALVLGTCKPQSRSEASLEADPFDSTQSETNVSLENYPRYWNDLARYLAGLPPEAGSQIPQLDEGALAQRHRKFFERSWKHESKRLQAMQKWREKELADVAHLKRPVFYPFSGPDFINIHTFYPNSPRYLLFGLEKPGTPPDVRHLTQQQERAFLSHLQKSLASILRVSFFRTLSMKVDFNNKSLDGLNPVLLAFIARQGNRVLDLTTLRVASDGKLYAIYSDTPFPPKNRDLPVYKPSPTGPKPIPGIRIRFVKPGSRFVQKLIFLSLDVSNSGLKTFSQFPAFLKKHCPCNTYLKAASYLMHRESFSEIRSLVLSQSQFLLQDDSGIPLRFFNKKDWDLAFYGNYTKPIRLFRVRYQPDLRKIYTSGKARPLPFGIGYNFAQGQSHLMAARKK